MHFHKLKMQFLKLKIILQNYENEFSKMQNPFEKIQNPFYKLEIPFKIQNSLEKSLCKIAINPWKSIFSRVFQDSKSTKFINLLIKFYSLIQTLNFNIFMNQDPYNFHSGKRYFIFRTFCFED